MSFYLKWKEPTESGEWVEKEKTFYGDWCDVSKFMDDNLGDDWPAKCSKYESSLKGLPWSTGPDISRRLEEEDIKESERFAASPENRWEARFYEDDWWSLYDMGAR